MAGPRRPELHAKTYVHLMDEGIGGAAFLDCAVAVADPERQGNARGNTRCEKTRRSTVCLGATSGRLEPK
jgi:hypothetical protein